METGLGLKSHPKDLRRPASNPRPPVNKASEWLNPYSKPWCSTSGRKYTQKTLSESNGGVGTVGEFGLSRQYKLLHYGGAFRKQRIEFKF